MDWPPCGRKALDTLVEPAARFGLLVTTKLYQTVALPPTAISSTSFAFLSDASNVRRRIPEQGSMLSHVLFFSKKLLTAALALGRP
jgi:hypothetical protein